jgi:hypothetical protein
MLAIAIIKIDINKSRFFLEKLFFLSKNRILVKIEYGPKVPKEVNEPNKLVNLVKPSLPLGSAKKSKFIFKVNCIINVMDEITEKKTKNFKIL